MSEAHVKLQIPLDKTLRDAIEMHARTMGFSSLQDFTRVMYATILNDKLRLSLADGSDQMSQEIVEYKKKVDQYEQIKNIVLNP